MELKTLRNNFQDDAFRQLIDQPSSLSDRGLTVKMVFGKVDHTGAMVAYGMLLAPPNPTAGATSPVISMKPGDNRKIMMDARDGAFGSPAYLVTLINDNTMETQLHPRLQEVSRDS